MAKSGLSLEELIEGQKRLAENQKSAADSQERISIAQLKEMTQTNKSLHQDKILQTIQTVESIKSENDESLSKEELKKGLIDKTGDGANANIIKMLKAIEKSNKLLEQQAKDVAGKAKDASTYKTMGDRIAGIKNSFKDFFSARGFLDKTGIAKRGGTGLLSQMADASEEKRKQIDMYSKSTGVDKETAKGIVEESNKNVKQSRKIESQISEYEKAGLTPPKELIDQRKEVSDKLSASDVRFQDKESIKSKAADENDMSESEIEQAQTNEDQTELLSKIEENTRGANADNVKPKEEKESKGGILSGIGSAFKGSGGALSGAAKGLLALAGALWITSKAFANFAEVDWGGMFKGILAMGALVVAVKALDGAKGGVESLLALGAALWITSKAFSNFAELDFSGILKGVIAIGALTLAVKALDGTAGGVAALLAMGAAVWVVSKAFANFAELDWGDLMKGVVVIGLLGAGLAAMSLLAIPIAITAAAFLVFGSAIWVLSKAFENIAESMPAFTDGLQRLADIGGAELIGVAAGIVAVGAAMALFGAAGMVTAMENLVTNFLSIGQDSPVEQLEKIGKAGAGIEKAASGLERMADAMERFGAVDSDKLDKAVDASEKIAKNGSKLPPSTSQAAPVKKAPMTNSTPTVTTESSSGTLKGVTTDQIKSHPNYKKYYQEAKSFPGTSDGDAYNEAAEQVKSDMVKANAVKPNQVTPTPSSKGTEIYNTSGQNAAMDKVPAKQAAPTIVSAPTQVNNQTQNAVVKSPVRNSDNTLAGYIKTRFAM
jgi:hypothetical protein